MTEQPVETEQQFLGNASYIAPRIVQPAGIECDGRPTCHASVHVEGCFATNPDYAAPIPLQHYVRNAHLRRPAWSSVDDVELAALARKSAHANKLAGIAKAQAVKAEDALKLALEVEADAVLEAHNAEQALLALVRKDAGL